MRGLMSGASILGGLLLLILGILMVTGLLDFLLRIGGVICIVIAVVMLFRGFTSRRNAL